MGHTADLLTAGTAPAGSAAARRERNFYFALGCAVLLHGSLLASAIRVDNPQQLGDPTGAEDAISVSLVTEADLQSRSTVAEPPQAPPVPENQPAPPPQQSAPQPPQPPEAQEQPAEPSPPQPEVQQQAAEPQPPDQQQTEPAKPEQAQVAKLEDPKSEAHAPDLFSLDDQNLANPKSEDQSKAKPEPSKRNPAKSSQKPANKPAKSPKKRVADLDLSAPQDAMPSFSGRSAGLQRPPGITRSGVNDAFARAVIRALQQTMPQLTNALGRVTVRILLSENGNVVEVRLLAGAKDSALNQDVVFAAQQTSYPIPPTGSTSADRTFMVTYIYD